ncbi:MAG: putrescine aminotransferase [Candidatus Melainabacteria bacterium]|jgi:putrescine aminotransferase|nr:putrescine aminotransferase [Candidatus Melainabacteria bacterium]
MGQDLEKARAKSREVLEFIAKPKLNEGERKQVIEESVKYWTEHVNAGFLQYRKSVSTDYTAVEWEDEGATFRDINGKEFIDMLGGYGVYNVGHRHPRVLKTVRDQLEKQAIHSQELIDPLRTYLAYLVSLITPGDLKYSFFTNSGTESVEGCLKMAMLATGRRHFIGTIGGFHGKSLGSLGGTSKAVFREPFLPLLNWSHVPFGDVEALETVFKCCDFSGDRIAAFVVEPLQGEGGINVAPPGYLAKARELCDKYGAMLVFDEIQCGMGRTGKMFYCQYDDVSPDLMALGKAFGGGVMPIGAVVGNEKTWSKYVENPFLHTTTFGGNPLSCAAAIATISILLDEDLPAQAKAKGDYMIPRMNELVKRYPDVMKEIRGVGLMLGMEFTGNDTGYEVAKHLFARNILISGTYINSKCLRVEPPLTISYEQIDTFLKALEESVAEVSKSAKSGLAPAIS